MIAKVVSHGANREEARRKLVAALRDFHVLGIKTNVGYLIEVLEDPEFIAKKIDTGFLGRRFDGWAPPSPPQELGAIASCAKLNSNSSTSQPGTPTSSHRAWSLNDSWRNVR
jgi:acetyl/propionyl-CoA carboxylase alpha subunit